jgi:hypothetical protein
MVRGEDDTDAGHAAMTGGSATGQEQPLDHYSLQFAEELRLLRVLLDCSRTQQQAAAARDVDLLGRATRARDEAMTALQESERCVAEGRTSLVREMAAGRTSTAGLKALAQHREAQALIAQLAQQDEDTKRALEELLNEARIGTQAAEAGEVTLAAYKRVVAPSPGSAELVDQRG